MIVARTSVLIIHKDLSGSEETSEGAVVMVLPITRLVKEVTIDDISGMVVKVGSKRLLCGRPKETVRDVLSEVPRDTVRDAIGELVRDSARDTARQILNDILSGILSDMLWDTL